MKGKKNKAGIVVCEFDPHLVKQEDENSEYYVVEGYASVYGNVDKARDIVMEGAFTADLLENGNERPILFQHNSNEPIGKGYFEDTPQGLKVTIHMPKDDEFVKNRVMPQIKIGSLKGLSIGYYIIEYSEDRENQVWKLTKLKLRETSVVTFACNEMAQITAAKQYLGIEEHGFKSADDYLMADESKEWNHESAVKSISENDGEGEFLFSIDGKDILPIGEYNEKGEFRVVPAAIFKSAGEIAAGKKYKLIPEDEVESIKSFLNEMYVRLGKQEPFMEDGKTFIDTATLKRLDENDMMGVVFNRNSVLSTGVKKFIVKSLCSPGGDGSEKPEEQKDDGHDDLKAMLKELKSNLT